MKLPELTIGKHTARFPVIQAGMGVRVGDGTLAGNVIKEGGFGVIASVGLCDITSTIGKGYVEDSNEKLREEIRIARQISGGKGPLGVNVMVALTNYDGLVKTAVDEGVDFIISGAGLPRNLPGLIDENVAVIPVVSSGRGAALIARTWKKKYNRRPDAIILEGPLCGGHLGFSYEQLENPKTRAMDIILNEVKNELGEEYSDIPLIAAEGINTKADIERFIEMGFQGVQIGTRFICMEESGMEPSGMEMYLKATKDDVVVIQSPVGLPVRVLRSPLVERVLSGKKEPFQCPYKCLLTCDRNKVAFCIAKALLASRAGDQENGLFMTGCNVEPIKHIMTVHEFFKGLE